MDLTLQPILARLSPEHATALEWFARHEGEIGPRPWRVGGKSVVPGVRVPLVAQRGIHQPSGWAMALSITATRASVYFDGVPRPIDSDTWVLPYMAHAGRDGAGTESRWNRALLANLRERVPVGVFVPSGSRYLNLGLAMVESFDAANGTFLLRGAVRPGQQPGVWDEDEGAPEFAADTDWRGVQVAREGEFELDEPTLYSRARRRIAQTRFREDLLSAYNGTCAVTGYDAPDALQGAHILMYRGRSSQLVRNGLLLRADIHLLFDRHLIGVDPDTMKVRLAPALARTAYGSLEKARLALPQRTEDAPDIDRLAVHWAIFERAAGSSA